MNVLRTIRHEECDAIALAHSKGIESGCGPTYLAIDILPRLFSSKEGKAWSIAKFGQVVAVNGGQRYAS